MHYSHTLNEQQYIFQHKSKHKMLENILHTLKNKHFGKVIRIQIIKQKYININSAENTAHEIASSILSSHPYILQNLFSKQIYYKLQWILSKYYL